MIIFKFHLFSIDWNILEYWLKHPLINYFVTLKYNLYKECKEEMFSFNLYLAVFKIMSCFLNLLESFLILLDFFLYHDELRDLSK